MEVLEKLNLEKADKNYYHATKQPEIRDLDSYYYLSVSGKCSPKDKRFSSAIEQLYAIVFGIKFLCKAEDMDFVVPKMEGYWWIDGGFKEQYKFTQTPESEWYWKIAIRMPDFVEQNHYERAITNVSEKKPELEVRRVKYELINQGKCVQILHVGPYENEEPTIMKMMQLMKENELKVAGYHHEIYLNDPRRVAPDKLKTILRYEVK